MLISSLNIIHVCLQECDSCVFTGSKVNDIRVVGCMLVILLFLIALVGLDWEAKVHVRVRVLG